MAQDTPVTHRNLVLYQVYVRNYAPNGRFEDVEADLERIKALGVDIVYFMPIHPIGMIERKGSLGSPYSISNYREVNPEYGSRADFERLVKKAHALGLKVMIDVVYNHTAHDSDLVAQHPDWFHQDQQGKPVTTVPEWSDVIDLKYPNPTLEEYLCETLAGWVEAGVDGFRCDVASLLPEDFWLRARARCAQVKPGVIWLAESVHAGFIGSRRAEGLFAISDSEVFRAFDMAYDYDIWPIWQAAVTGVEPAARYLEMVRLQNCIFPANYVKMRCVENHDQARILRLAPSENQALAWTAFQAFNRGAFMIYAGQESGATHTPSLFDIDRFDWGDYRLSSFLTTLARLKKDPAQLKGVFTVAAAAPAVTAAWEAPGNCLLGIFNIDGVNGGVNVPIPDGTYQDVLSGLAVQVKNGEAPVPASAAILRYSDPVKPRWFYSPLFDLHIPRDSA